MGMVRQSAARGCHPEREASRQQSHSGATITGGIVVGGSSRAGAGVPGGSCSGTGSGSVGGMVGLSMFGSGVLTGIGRGIFEDSVGHDGWGVFNFVDHCAKRLTPLISEWLPPDLNPSQASFTHTSYACHTQQG